MCGVQIKTEKGLSMMLGVNETIDQLEMENSVCLYDHVIRKDSHLLRRSLMFEVEG